MVNTFRNNCMYVTLPTLKESSHAWKYIYLLSTVNIYFLILKHKYVYCEAENGMHTMFIRASVWCYFFYFLKM